MVTSDLRSVCHIKTDISLWVSLHSLIYSCSFHHNRQKVYIHYRNNNNRCTDATVTPLHIHTSISACFSCVYLYKEFMSSVFCFSASVRTERQQTATDQHLRYSSASRDAATTLSLSMMSCCLYQYWHLNMVMTTCCCYGNSLAPTWQQWASWWLNCIRVPRSLMLTLPGYKNCKKYKMIMYQMKSLQIKYSYQIIRGHKEGWGLIVF